MCLDPNGPLKLSFSVAALQKWKIFALCVLLYGLMRKGRVWCTPCIRRSYRERVLATAVAQKFAV